MTGYQELAAGAGAGNNNQDAGQGQNDPDRNDQDQNNQDNGGGEGHGNGYGPFLHDVDQMQQGQQGHGPAPAVAAVQPDGDAQAQQVALQRALWEPDKPRAYKLATRKQALMGTAQHKTAGALLELLAFSGIRASLIEGRKPYSGPAEGAKAGHHINSELKSRSAIQDLFLGLVDDIDKWAVAGLLTEAQRAKHAKHVRTLYKSIAGRWSKVSTHAYHTAIQCQRLCAVYERAFGPVPRGTDVPVMPLFPVVLLAPVPPRPSGPRRLRHRRAAGPSPVPNTHLPLPTIPQFTDPMAEPLPPAVWSDLPEHLNPLLPQGNLGWSRLLRVLVEMEAEGQSTPGSAVERRLRRALVALTQRRRRLRLLSERMGSGSEVGVPRVENVGQFATNNWDDLGYDQERPKPRWSDPPALVAAWQEAMKGSLLKQEYTKTIVGRQLADRTYQGSRSRLNLTRYWAGHQTPRAARAGTLPRRSWPAGMKTTTVISQTCFLGLITGLFCPCTPCPRPNSP